MIIHLYIASTPYHILSSLLNMSKLKRKSIIVLVSNFEDDFIFFKEICSKLKEFPYVEEVLVIEPKKKFYRILGYKKEYKYLIKKYDIDHVFIFPWNLCKFYTNSNYFFKKFKKNKNISLFEDGSNVYLSDKKQNLIVKIIQFLFGIENVRNNIKYLDYIYVTHLDKFPSYMRSKLRPLNINDELNKLDKNESDFLKKVFIDKKDLKILNNIESGRINILFTQPFYRDFNLEPKKQTEVYNRLISEYSKENFLIVKKHPRDELHYKTNEKCISIYRKTPSEIINTFGIKFDKSIGISSSAIRSVVANQYIDKEYSWTK